MGKTRQNNKQQIKVCERVYLSDYTEENSKIKKPDAYFYASGILGFDPNR